MEYAYIRISNKKESPHLCNMIRIAIAEDITRLGETLKNKIELLPDFKVSFIAVNGRKLINELSKNHNIDVIFMDINMPEMNGIDATEAVCSRWPKIKVIVSSVYDDEDNIFDAVLAGAMGYLLKDEKPENIHRAIYQVLDGGVPMSPLIARKALKLIRSGKPAERQKVDYGLTTRETEILEHLSNGLSYEQIANNLFISKGTVRKHVENSYRKLQVNNKIEAIKKVNS
jgi:DNA-binding NarL/FixJ family response regulator